MDTMKQRFVNAVTSSLSAAPDSAARAELIEELADNLHQRFLDMTADGMTEGEAFEKALDELGDTEELIDYLKSLSPEEELPERSPDLDQLDDFIQNTLKLAQDAISSANEKLRGVLSKAKHYDGKIDIHIDMDDDDHGEHPYGEDHEDEEWDFSDDDDLEDLDDDDLDDFDGDDDLEDLEDLEDLDDIDADGHPERVKFPSQDLRGVALEMINGDVTICLVDDENAPVVVDNSDGLVVRSTPEHTLIIRQGDTATSSFFFGRGFYSRDVVLYLPRKHWEFIRISSTNGDVTLDDGIEADQLSVRTHNGDLHARRVCGSLYFKSGCGDCTADCTGDAQCETYSGDIHLSGSMGQVQLSSMSGDVTLNGDLIRGRFRSMSGDIRLKLSTLPQTLEADSKSGDCDVSLPTDQGGFLIRGSTTSGDIRSRIPLRRTRQGLVFQDGGERTFSISTTSGDLYLRKA